ncbi:MAG: TrmH family RNA methyltransferase [Elainellaceae cyanobacterium]
MNLPQINRHTYIDLPRHPLIVCATLVQNPANLGGLCRTAEVFRLESLVLSALAIAQTAPFRRLSTSAHHWQPLSECSIADLPAWLNRRKHDGYCLTALHADSNAKPLTEFRYPTRSVLLIGRELTGIPIPLIEQCDDVITIPQFGLVESLNVQNAAAIAIYEYIRQQTGQSATRHFASPSDANPSE